ncbi:MAG: DNA mismatch repair endonuclease MutL [Opitutales bacterium]
MTPSIQILSDRVANQIAAGEVIERPVAVIKELVENSLDAGATRIEVEFRNGGKAYMRVEDNGRGMTPDEALLCLERHATSKIRSAEDLQEVTSFGFRGEALPSIASVARFTLRTRHESFEHGTEITINGGKLLDKKDCGMPVGTRIEVAQLFNAVPARRKFLKTDATETAHITYNCRLFAIANPSVHFRVLENGREVFQSPSGLPLRDRIGEIWGRQLAGDLISVDQSDEAAGLRLTGLTAKPGIGRSTRRELITLVNRRPVDNRTLGFAVLDAYHGHLPKGRYPPAFLFLEISPREMDVNVHPAKREVRFRQEGAIRRFVLAAITDTLQAYRDAQTAAPVPKTTPTEPPAKPATPADTTRAAPRAGATGPAPGTSPAASAEPPGTRPPPVTTPAPPPGPPPGEAKTSKDPPAEHAPSHDRPRQSWRLLSRLKERYALMETPRGLVILHLRQADQRIRYEQILRTFTEKAEIESQGLLIAEPLEFEPLAAEALESNLSLLNEHGFAIEPFGRNFYRIEAVPGWLAADRAESFIRDLVDELRQRGTTSHRESVVWESVARLAVKESYQRSDPISTQSIEAMAAGLLKCEVPHSSPFGRPTYQEIGWSELERRFGG